MIGFLLILLMAFNQSIKRKINTKIISSPRLHQYFPHPLYWPSSLLPLLMLFSLPTTGLINLSLLLDVADPSSLLLEVAFSLDLDLDFRDVNVAELPMADIIK